MSFSAFDEGYIVFLKNHDLVRMRHLEQSGLERDALGHPALVVGHSGQIHLHICILTSFRVRSIDDSYTTSPAKPRDHLPIFPCPPITPGGPQLFMQSHLLERHCYVKINAVHTVHMEMLEPYRRRQPAHNYVLTNASLEQVKEALGPRLPLAQALKLPPPAPRPLTADDNRFLAVPSPPPPPTAFLPEDEVTPPPHPPGPASPHVYSPRKYLRRQMLYWHTDVVPQRKTYSTFDPSSRARAQMTIAARQPFEPRTYAPARGHLVVRQRLPAWCWIPFVMVIVLMLWVGWALYRFKIL